MASETLMRSGAFFSGKERNAHAAISPCVVLAVAELGRRFGIETKRVWFSALTLHQL